MELYINLSRFHPLLVHLPIGILCFAFFMEIYQKWKKTKELNIAIDLALLLGFMAALSSVITGLSLANEGGYEMQALNLHKWMGIGLTILSFGLYRAKNTSINWLSKLYQPLFIGVMILLTITGHYGGNLTHGSDYLFTSGKSQAISVANIETANVYQTIIEPILKHKCNGCHNPSKAKGDLIMTTQEALLKGGKNGSIFNFEEIGKSELLVRAHLPLEEEEHMPPKGKKQLEEEEINLLTWWITNKACFDCMVEETTGREQIEKLLEKYETTNINMAAIAVKPVKKETLAKLNEAGIRVQPLSETSSFLLVDVSNTKTLNPTTLKKIKKIGKNVLELNLANTNFSDGQASIFKSLPHLQKLQLQGTLITNKTVVKLKRLKYLASLNLYKTAVTDAALPNISKIKTLKTLYTWQSKITDEAMAKFQKSKPLLQIQHQLDETIFGVAELLPPTIVADNQLFNDSVVVTFELNFRNTTIYYTLDGSDPDSTATVFKDSLILRSSTKLKAYVAKKGWGKSAIVSKQFIKTKNQLVNATLNKLPNENYQGKSAKTLIDLEKGSNDFKDGRWLGYQGKHFITTVELKELAAIKTVFVSALAAPSAWIFYPQGFKVEVSEDGQSFQSVGEKKVPITENDMESGMQYFDIHFPKVKAKFVRVEVQSLLKNPPWHPAASENCWLFVDEIMVD